MKLHFDASQEFQIDAVSAVTGIFDGLPKDDPDYSVIHVEKMAGLFSGLEHAELGFGNRVLVDDVRLLENVRKIQDRNAIEVNSIRDPLEGWNLFDRYLNAARICPHFSVEMETGTGKTYVYLRTIFELSRQYGIQKFVIVVPSVAIREGVLKNIEITADHFRSLYNNIPFEHYVYDGKRVSQLRQFANSANMQVLIINIDAFRKNFSGTDDQQKSNVIYKESDRLSGRQPIEFIQATRPVVIIDEPQSVDSTDKAQEAIKALNPLLTLRYSATHKNPYNLIYRLDPVRAFSLGLVKQIVVGSAVAEGGANDAFVRVEKIDYQTGIKVKIRFHEQTSDGPKEKSKTVKNGTDLFVLSNERACYKDGFAIAEINAEPGNEFVRFSNGRVLKVGEECGGVRDDVWRLQIKHTVKKHLEKELQLRGRGIKVLSLFFIDRVANYRGYDEQNKATKGKFALAFEEAIDEYSKDARFAELEWLKHPVDKLHNGYFSQDKKGVLKDTRGDTQSDDDTYSLIMKEKERLLSLDEPLRFIFSHSALREGWDNPNVFQICTLNESQSVVKKRQEIGRGLRLPVDQTGHRVKDESINKLFVMANESYEDFARGLQNEYETDCGITFGKVPVSAIARLTRIADGQEVGIGRDAAEVVKAALIEQGLMEGDGRLLPAFDPANKSFKLEMPAGFESIRADLIDLLNSHRIERHIRRERDERTNKLRKEVTLSPEFVELWDRIKPRTTYKVEFSTEVLIARAVEAIGKMPRIEAPKVAIRSGKIKVEQGGVSVAASGVSHETLSAFSGRLPDILAYLQNETELTRSTLVQVLSKSGRLDEFFVDPQRFMDAVAKVLRHEVRRLLVDGIKYERIGGSGKDKEWQMMMFKNEELIDYLSALEVKCSIYNYVVYDSDVERVFAKTLDERDDIKLFVKLPSWFKIETPLGTYNPDWAVVKHDDETVYMVCETKGTKDLLKLRTTEADKIRCGQRHFEALDNGIKFEIAQSASEI